MEGRRPCKRRREKKKKERAISDSRRSRNLWVAGFLLTLVRSNAICLPFYLRRIRSSIWGVSNRWNRQFPAIAVDLKRKKFETWPRKRHLNLTACLPATNSDKFNIFSFEGKYCIAVINISWHFTRTKFYVLWLQRDHTSMRCFWFLERKSHFISKKKINYALLHMHNHAFILLSFLLYTQYMIFKTQIMR